MSSVHYKFSSKLSYDVVTFRGPSISVGDLKRQIMARERLKVANCDLQILKAETSEEYSDDAQIPKNVSVIVKRVPARAICIEGIKREEFMKTNFHIHSKWFEVQTPNLAEANATEEDKIKAMMIQSCRYYEPL
ncbi:E3 ubiquitin-protein ligase RBBP6, partial [Lonchura striata]